MPERASPKLRGALGVLAVLLLCVPPIVVDDPYWQHLMVMTLIFGTLALSLDLILGDMGQFSFGHQAFFGVAAYVTAILTVKFSWPVWFGIVAGIAASALLGLLVGFVALRRARGLYLAIITLGVGQIIHVVMASWYDMTGGISGIPMIPPIPLYVPFVGRIELSDEFSFYYFALAVLVATIYVIVAWRRSRDGRAVAAIRENEEQARAIGINPFRYYLQAFVLASALAGVAGVTYAHFNGQVAPLSLSLYYMFWMLVMVVVGGMRTIPGPIIGAWIFVFVPEFLSAAQEWRIIIFGALLLVTVIAMPQGVYPVGKRMIVMAFRRSRGPARESAALRAGAPASLNHSSE